ncbi:hypothetical protein AOPFMNJM_2028 [Methylobacterium jeotgali]|uniref:AB hydrolase-1 domain-containing protein n=1 Tax=Methylobacterium jeotgali TaxID=381630 RepID=A0ABQ4SWU8_9HYPH|nr:hypothetical protein AwMethylo_16930 [Methylobacterium sp.]GJE06706.1 hypothetical protein AOPFMNJM_2028 [Methylobacterium jeotgali]
MSAAPDTTTLALALDGRPLPTPCDRYGPEDAPPALLLPALSSIASRAEMAGLARALAPDYRCLVPDWPGFGDRDRARLPLSPALMNGFLDALLAALPGPFALGIGAGHGATYLAAAAGRHPGRFARLVMVAPTWRGPLPTAMGAERAPLFRRIRRAVEAPVLGHALYRINLSTPVIARMMRAHVYADPARVTPALVAAKRGIARRAGGRFGTAAFVTGGLDPVESRQAFLALFAEPISGPLPPVSLLRPQAAPRRSGAEMDALAAHLGGAGSVPGALSPHEEYPEAVAEAIRAEVGRAI